MKKQFCYLGILPILLFSIGCSEVRADYAWTSVQHEAENDLRLGKTQTFQTKILQALQTADRDLSVNNKMDSDKARSLDRLVVLGCALEQVYYDELARGLKLPGNHKSLMIAQLKKSERLNALNLAICKKYLPPNNQSLRDLESAYASLVARIAELEKRS